MLRTEGITARIGDVLVAKLGINADSVVEVANIEMDLGGHQPRYGRNHNVAGG